MNIPLFPLNTVLFPQGLLPLRVFEVRYTDMVRDCLRQGTPFGVVNITRGSDFQAQASAPAPEHALLGCLASIVDFDMVEPAVLMIAAQGGQRFHTISTNVLGNGLIQAQIETLPPDTACPITPEHENCRTLLGQIIKELEHQQELADKAGHKTFCFPIAKPYALDDAGWLANRFAELLPISQHKKQHLLTLQSPLERLQWVHDFLKEKEVL